MAAATRGLNRLDNVEQVLVESPVAGGLYQVIVAPAPDELLVDESGESAAQVVSVVISGLEAVADSAAAELLLESDELGWSPLPGVVYHVETAAELAGSWMAVSNGVSFERSPVFTPIDRDSEESHRFWRVRRSE